MVTIASSGHHCIVQPQYRVIESGESGWDWRKSWMVSFSIDSTHSLLVKSQEVEKVQKPRTFNCLFIQHYTRYCSSSSWSNWSAIQPRHIIQHKLHLSRVVSLFLAQMITFGSNDHFQGAGPALPTERFFFSRRQWGNKTNGTGTNFHKSETWSPFIGSLYPIQSNRCYIWDNGFKVCADRKWFLWSYQILLILLLLH